MPCPPFRHHWVSRHRVSDLRIHMKQNAIQRTLAGGSRPVPGVRIEGRWIYYCPSFVNPDKVPELQEWGGRWDKSKLAWRLPLLTRMLTKIFTLDPGVPCENGVREFVEESWDLKDFEAMNEVWKTLGYKKGGFLNTRRKMLREYQKQAVRALVTRPLHGTHLVLTPGLGKTPTSIVAADLYLEAFGQSERVLVVCPKSLAHQWAREIEFWSVDSRIEIVHPEIGDVLAPTPDRSVKWTVTNYDQLHERIKNDNGNTIVTGNLNEDFDLDWDVVIFDESVLLKNRKSKRFSASRTLARTSQKAWLLSGAPTTKDNSDIWSQFSLIEPDYFTSFWRFAEEVCIVVKTQWSQGEILGSRRDFDMRAEYPDIMFVRNQEEVFDDLPEYIHRDVEIILHKKQQKAHQDILDNWLHELEENRDKRVEVTAVIAMLTRLQQVTSNLYNLETTGTEWPDYSAKADFVEEFLGGGDLEWPVLIWCHHRPGARALLDRLRKQIKKKDSALYRKRAELVVGGTKGADKIIEEYKAGKVDVLILGITVGKYGHTLANSKTIITYDKTWDSDAWFQMLHRAAGARAKLAGYTHRPLLVNPRCRGTVDDYVELNLAGKLPTMSEMTGADLAKVLRSLGEEHVK